MRPIEMLRKGLIAITPVRALLSYEANALSATLSLGGRELERRITFSGEAKPVGATLVVIPDTVEGVNTKGLSLEMQSKFGTLSYGLIVRYPKAETLPEDDTALLADVFAVSEFDPSLDASTLETGTGICSDTECLTLELTDQNEPEESDAVVVTGLSEEVDDFQTIM